MPRWSSSASGSRRRRPIRPTRAFWVISAPRAASPRLYYAAGVECSERLAALLPDPLDTVFLVNSGSEASDLAIRLATAATGRRDVVAVREAYHGWTYGMDAVSTSTADIPNAVSTRPD